MYVPYLALSCIEAVICSDPVTDAHGRNGRYDFKPLQVSTNQRSRLRALNKPGKPGRCGVAHEPTQSQQQPWTPPTLTCPTARGGKRCPRKQLHPQGGVESDGEKGEASIDSCLPLLSGQNRVGCNFSFVGLLICLLPRKDQSGSGREMGMDMDGEISRAKNSAHTHLLQQHRETFLG